MSFAEWRQRARLVLALARLAEGAQGWPVAVQAVRAALATDPPPQARLRLEICLADWLAGPLEAPEEALEWAQRISTACPDDAEAHQKVGRLLARLARHAERAEWLSRPAPGETAAAARARKVELAELQDEVLHDRPAALVTWRDLLDADVADAQALAEVERLSAELDDWAGLAELCRAHAERMTDPAARAARFQRLGDLYAGPLDLPAAALGAYREALAADPGNPTAAAAFEAFCLQSGHLDALNAWYATQQGVALGRGRPVPPRPVPAGPEPSLPEFEIPVDDLAPAEALALDGPRESLPPEDLQAMDAALVAPPAPTGLLVDRATRALEAAYRGEGRWSELAALYRRRLAVTRDAEQAATLEGALLDLYLGPADDPGRAAELLEQRLAHEKHPRFLLEQIADLQRRAGDGAGLARTLRTRAELAGLPEADRLALFDELAKVHRDLLHDRAAARGWWQAALEFDPGFAPALAGLKDALAPSAPKAEVQGVIAASVAAPASQAQLTPPRPPAEPIDPAQVKRYRVRRANPARRRKILTGLAIFGLFWAVVATGAFIIQSMRLDRTADEMATANRAYTRLAKEVNTTQARFTEVAQALNKQHGDGTPLEMYAADPVAIPDGEASVLTDQILGIAINDIKMRGAVDAMRDLVSGVVEQREIAVAQAEDLKARLDGVSQQLASLEGKKEVADEILAQRLDENIEQLEVALDVTGLDTEGLLAPNLEVPEGDEAEGAVGGPWVSASVTYASPLPGKTEVMSGFGHRGHEHHNGIDIPGPFGTPVRSVADGEVVFVQDRPTWDARPKFITRDGKRIKSPGWRAGVYVEVQHGDGRVSRYLHLDDVAAGIEPGVKVRKRQVIGTLGRTAVEHSETHLHFELREPSDNPTLRWGDPVDPEAPLSTPDPNRVAKGVQALKDRTERLSAIVTGEPFVEAGQGLEGDDEEPSDAKANATAQVIGSLGLQGRVDRLQSLEKVLRAMPLVAPVDDFKISSGFGARQDPMHPEETGFHSGLDIPGEERSAVMVTAPGTVTFSGWKGGFGRVVEVDHGHGIVTRYAHLYKSLVRVGQRVSLREKIGQMGSTGRSTGTHLHYEVQVEGKATDPLRFLKAGRAIFDK
ncbi:MAG: peptidoglycan DD-metalloendopeptidase family protein [Myxococcales bacterium]|nr:peptidoglycan DD-metalloendopeptidase family protein [Myxococcales bacterium]